MGYASQVRFMTTTKGFEKIKKLADKRYDELLQKEIEKGSIDEKWSSNENEICVKQGDHFGCIYRKKLSFDYDYLNEDLEGYVMFGFDWVKWLGYDHLERKAYEWACDHCGEFVRCLMVGEDGATEESEWNDEKDDGNMPYVSAYTRIDDEAWC